MMSLRRWLVLESEIYWAEIRMVNPRFSLPRMATMLTFSLACVGEGGVLTVKIQWESGVPLIDNQHLSLRIPRLMLAEKTSDREVQWNELVG